MITYPLEGCKGIGYMLQRLKEAVKEGGNIGEVSVILNSIYLGSLGIAERVMLFVRAVNFRKCRVYGYS